MLTKIFRDVYIRIFGENMNVISKSTQFLQEVIRELKKVTWPDKKQIIASSIVVIILVVIVAIYVGIIDFVLSKILAVLLS